eukprot:4201340-Amphidinium_carterae.1
MATLWLRIFSYELLQRVLNASIVSSEFIPHCCHVQKLTLFMRRATLPFVAIRAASKPHILMDPIS